MEVAHTDRNLVDEPRRPHVALDHSEVMNVRRNGLEKILKVGSARRALPSVSPHVTYEDRMVVGETVIYLHHRVIAFELVLPLGEVVVGSSRAGAALRRIET